MPTKISCNTCWKLTAVYHNIKLYIRMMDDAVLPPMKLSFHSVTTFSNVLVCMRSAGLTVLVHSMTRLKTESAD